MRVKFGECRHLKKVTARVSAGPVFSVVATDSADNIYEAIEGVASKIERQILRKKNKLIHKSRKRTKLHLVDDDRSFQKGE